MSRYTHTDYAEAGRTLARNAERFGRWSAGIEPTDPHAGRNVARMNRAAVYAVPLENNDTPRTWERLRAQSDALVALWSAFCVPS